jgi:hypothetical protein
MSWCTTADLDRFAAAAGGYLRSRAAENTLLLSAAQAGRDGWRGPAAGLAAGTAPGTGGQDGAVPVGAASIGVAAAGAASAGPPANAVGPLFGWWEPPDGGGPRGAFLHDPRAPLLIAGRAPEMAVALAALLAKTGRPVCGVDAPVEAADAFAAAWHQRAGTAVQVHGACRVYRLVPASAGGVEAPGPAGSLRVATAADRPLLAEWLTAFALEAGHRIGSPQDLAGDLIGYGGAVFWDVPERASLLSHAAQFLAGPYHRDASRDAAHRDTGPHPDPGFQPVAMAVLTRPVAGTVRISMVYTLPDRRRNGYAAAVTFAASRAALDGPAFNGPALDGIATSRPGPVTEVVLITDGSRPDRRVTRLGYQLVDERAMFRFGPPTGPMPRLKSATGPMPRLPTGPLPRLRR